MAPHSFQFIAARPAPVKTEGLLPWIRSNLFGTRLTAASTLLLLCLLAWTGLHLLNWAVWTAVWAPNVQACRTDGVGACWGVIAEKYRLIIFGRYPFEEQWRPLLATVLLLALLLVSCTRAFWKPWLALLWAAVLGLFFTVMHGGMAGLSRVETDLWGGLPLTILLASLSMVMAFPIAVLVALGRRSSMPAVRSVCTVYVELIRGVPLISVLIRVLAGITVFAAAYMAEVIRGGLQGIPKGQIEAAATLGLTYWQPQRKIVLPQALAMVVPGIVNNFISTFKDTSLVTIVSLYELTGAMGLALNSDADWRAFKI